MNTLCYFKIFYTNLIHSNPIVLRTTFVHYTNVSLKKCTINQRNHAYSCFYKYQRTNHSLTRGRVAQASLTPLLTPHVQSCTN